jgi:hypothetical protein
MQIASFANSLTDQSLHKVELINDWGGPLSEKEDSIYFKRCEHGGFGPEKALCAYLMEHTSTEFPSNNVRRALVCLNTEESRPYMTRHPEYTTLKVHSSTAKYVRGRATVGVDYSAEQEMMTISVRRFDK